MLFAGIDVGSTITKLVLRSEKETLAVVIRPTGAEHRRLAHKVLEEGLAKLGASLADVDYIVATGYGRINVPFADAQASELTCHAKGVSWLFPRARTVIDIGGQDCKGIKLQGGKMRSFVMNDRCAAGTGRFLEVTAEALGLTLAELGARALEAASPVEISRTCTVFAVQEIYLRLAEGLPLNEILAGLHKALATRIYSLVSPLGIEEEVVVTGGGAKNPALLKYLGERLGSPLSVPEEPLVTGALGAALLAEEKAAKAPADKETRRLEAVSFFKGGEES